jgi:hypothetical protein
MRLTKMFLNIFFRRKPLRKPLRHGAQAQAESTVQLIPIFTLE